MNLKTQLEEFEGRIPYAYKDHLGFWTIGVGRLIDKRKGGGLDDEEIDFLLDRDINKRRAVLYEKLPWLVGLDEVRQAVIIGMSFQMGIDGLMEFQRTLSSVRDGHYADAAQQMMQSLWAKQTPDRARRLARQMEIGEWN